MRDDRRDLVAESGAEGLGQGVAQDDAVLAGDEVREPALLHAFRQDRDLGLFLGQNAVDQGALHLPRADQHPLYPQEGGDPDDPRLRPERLSRRPPILQRPAIERDMRGHAEDAIA
jgi:hypothetical protein